MFSCNLHRLLDVEKNSDATIVEIQLAYLEDDTEPKDQARPTLSSRGMKPTNAPSAWRKGADRLSNGSISCFQRPKSGRNHVKLLEEIRLTS